MPRHPNLSTADLLTHPVRARILITAMGREVTTAQIAARLPDVPRASLYRQIRTLLRGGLLEIVRETPVRGTIEKVYAVPRDSGQIPAAEVAGASRAEHFRHFRSFLDTMAGSYREYLEGVAPDPPSEVTMVATPLQLSEADTRRFKADLQQLLRGVRQRADQTARRRVLWIASIPDPADPL